MGQRCFACMGVFVHWLLNIPLFLRDYEFLIDFQNTIHLPAMNCACLYRECTSTNDGSKTHQTSCDYNSPIKKGIWGNLRAMPLTT